MPDHLIKRTSRVPVSDDRMLDVKPGGAWFSEGQTDPVLNKTIKILIQQGDGWLVYLDTDLYVEWHYVGDIWPRDGGRVMNRVSILECAPSSHLTDAQRLSVQRLLGEAVARMFDAGNCADVWPILDQADAYYQTRGNEVARGWFLQTSMIVLLIGLTALTAIWLCRAVLRTWFGPVALDFLIAVPLGLIGAYLSIVFRLGSVEFSPAAGKRLHQWVCMARMLAAALGSAVVMAAVESGLFLPRLFADHVSGRLLAFVVACAAGASERLIPGLIKRVELGLNDTASDSPKTSPPSKPG